MVVNEEVAAASALIESKLVVVMKTMELVVMLVGGRYSKVMVVGVAEDSSVSQTTQSLCRGGSSGKARTTGRQE
ncbi:hypothetical protein Tco_0087269 [Tanacetum coccineum]